MSRPLRIEYTGAWYHVMNRGRRKEDIFYDGKDCEIFLDVLEQTICLFKIEVHSYSLMPNHYHLLLHTPDGNLSRAMRHLNGVYTQRYNKKHKIDGALFRGRYKSILVEEDVYLLEVFRYIHRNAIEAGLEKKIGDYIWDSHIAYMKEKNKLGWLVTEDVLLRFSDYEKEAKHKMNMFVNEQVPDNLLKILESVNCPSILGKDSFKEKIKSIIIKDKKIDTKEIKGYGEYREKENNEREIEKIISGKEEILKKRKSKKYAIERRAIMYLLRIYGKTLKEIGECMGNISYVSVSRQCKQAEEDIKKKIGCYKNVKEITEIVKLQV